jgi:4-diphosphocytidyl-2-C-methyl-D-erythritol kinase
VADSLTVRAPAKINLWLRVLRRRDDGFHDIDTRLVPIGLADHLAVARVDGPPGEIRFTCSDPSVPSDASNLVLEALAAVQECTGPLPALVVQLEKAIPHGAGLGGGSSDAAATLRAVNDLLGLNLDRATLARLAAQLGSDVPFFLDGSAADCRGRGEIVDPVPGPPLELPILLVKLPFPVPTRWAYQQWHDSTEIPGIRYDPQPLPFGSLVNDLERPVFAKHIVLADLKMWLLDRPEVSAALLSGSGSTLFTILRDGSPATALVDAIRSEYDPDLWWWQGWTE